MIEDLAIYLREAPWKDLATPLIAGIFTIVVAVISVYGSWAEGNRKRREAHDKEQREREHSSDVLQTQDFTARFRALMDGYEARIKDLSEELIAVKKELRDTRKELDARHAS